jgi:hypothetical protein
MPMHSGDTLPGDWHVRSPVQARIDGRHLVLRRHGGAEMSFAFNQAPGSKTRAERFRTCAGQQVRERQLVRPD